MKQIKTFFAKFITYIFAVLFAGSLAANAEIKVVTTIKPLHSLISNVMDGVGEPSLIIEGSTSPHSFVLKPSHAKMIEQADIIFWIGEDIIGHSGSTIIRKDFNRNTIHEDSYG